MNMKNLMAAAAAAMVAAGCCDKNNCGDACQKAGAAEPVKAAEVTLPQAAEAKDTNEVVAEVAGEKLTRGELDAQTEEFLSMAAKDAPPERKDMMRKMARRRVMQAFISGKALRKAAADRGYTMTKDEIAAKEKEFLARIASQPGAPKTIDELLAMQPGDKNKALDELHSSFLFEKMIEGEVLSKDTKDYTAKAKEIVDQRAAESAKTLPDEEALKKLTELKAEIDAAPAAEKAAKFAALAKKHSACPSGQRGGDLDFFGHGQMVPEFDKAAFALDVGAVSEPVKTQFGYHLIMTTDKKAAVEAKDGKPAEPEKVRASHILVKTGTPEPVPALEDVVNDLKRGENRQAVAEFVMDAIRTAVSKVADEFNDMLPPPKAAPAPEAKPAPAPEATPAPAPEAKAAPAPATAPAPAETTGGAGGAGDKPAKAE